MKLIIIAVLFFTSNSLFCMEMRPVIYTRGSAALKTFLTQELVNTTPQEQKKKELEQIHTFIKKQEKDHEESISQHSAAIELLKKRNRKLEICQSAVILSSMIICTTLFWLFMACKYENNNSSSYDTFSS